MKKRTKVVFLDRDGVINREREGRTIDSWGEFRFVPGSLKALRLLKENKYRVIVVSNQAGVAKGLYSMKDLQAMTKRIKRTVQKHGGRLDAVYYCPHLPEDRCSCRKPKTGLFRKAKRKFKIQFPATTMIGDSVRDILAAKTLGCQTILVLSGRETLSRRRLWKVQPDTVKKNLLDAVRWMLKQEVHRSHP